MGEQQNMQPPKSRKYSQWWIVGAIVVIVLILAVGMLMSNLVSTVTAPKATASSENKTIKESCLMEKEDFDKAVRDSFKGMNDDGSISKIKTDVIDGETGTVEIYLSVAANKNEFWPTTKTSEANRKRFVKLALGGQVYAEALIVKTGSGNPSTITILFAPTGEELGKDVVLKGIPMS